MEETEKSAGEPKKFQPAITDRLTQTVTQAVNHIGQLHQQMTEAHQQALQHMQQSHIQMMQKMGEAVQAMNTPKRIIRGADGRISGIEPIQQEK